MHPMMIMALAREVEREHQRGPDKAHLPSLPLPNRAHGLGGSRVASRFTRRPLAGTSLRRRLS